MNSTTLERATLGGGCFWCLEAVFETLKGVTKVESGYAGGHVSNPTYERVCVGTTGHAEVIQITFDPSIITFRQLLDIFFQIHDPTTLNRQGADVGTQYRSVIFYNSEAQKLAAQAVKEDIEEKKIWSDRIVTEIIRSEVFYRAENYHQGYFRANQTQPYCQMVIVPKILKAEAIKKLIGD